MTDKKNRLFNEIIQALSLALDFDDGAKLYHAWRVAILSYEISEWMDLPNTDMVFYAGMLHDIGAMGMEDHIVHLVSDNINNAEIRAHPEKVSVILKSFLPFHKLAPYVAQHHENHNGTGYPHGKKGDDILLEAGIINLADNIEIMLRKESSVGKQKKAISHIRKQSGKLYNPAIASAAIELFKKEPELLDNLFNEKSLNDMISALQPNPSRFITIPEIDMKIQFLSLFARVIDAKHTYTAGHSFRVSFYAYKIARLLGEDQINSWDILWAGLLHDVGKVGVPRKLLDKKGKLSKDEITKIQKHASDSEKIISTISSFERLAYPAASHHERYDGMGYPYRKSGESIPLLGRIFAFADVYDALTSERAYRGALSHDVTISMIKKSLGTHFDPHLGDFAIEALTRNKPESTEFPATMEGLHHFFGIEEPGKTKAEPGKRLTIKKVEDDLLVMDKEHWKTVMLSLDLEIIDNRRDIENIAGIKGLKYFQDFLDGEDRDIFKKGMLGLEENSICSRRLFTRSGQSIEIIGSRRPDHYDIYFRFGESQINLSKKMSFLYRNFFKSSEPVIFTDNNLEIVDVNGAFIELYRYKLYEIIGKKIHAVFAEGNASEVYKEMQTIITKEGFGTLSGELKTVTRDSTELVNMVNISSVKDSAGIPAGYVWHMVDITSDKETELSLRASEQAFRDMFDLAADPIVVHDLNGNLLEVNQLACEKLGFSRNEFLQMNVAEIDSPAGKLEFSKNIELLKNSKKLSLEAIQISKDGREIPVEINAKLIEYRGKPAIISIARDITERKRTEEALRKSEEKFRSLFESAPDPIHVLDTQGNIIRTNPIAIATLGYSEDKIIGRSLAEFFTPDSQRVFAEQFPVIVEKGANRQVVEMVCKDGRVINVDCSARVILDERGELSGFVTYQRDVTDSKRADLLQQVMLNIATAAQTVDNLKELLASIHSELSALMDITNFYVALYDNYANTYSFPYVVDESLFIESFVPKRLVGSYTDYVRRYGRSLLFNAGDPPPEMKSGEVIKEMGVESHSWLGVPLKTSRGVIGVMTVQSYDESLSYTETDQELLTIVAGNIAPFILHKQAEEALRESEGKLDGMLRSLVDNVIMMDRDLNILWANDVAKEIFGNDIVSKKFYEVFHSRDNPCDPSPCLALKTFEDGQIHKRETSIQCPDGRILSFACTSNVALRDNEGNPTGVIEVLHDITERKRMRKELERRLLIEQSIGYISSLLVSGGEIDMNEILKALGSTFDADRAFIYKMHDDHTLTSNTYEWCAEGTEPQIENLQNLDTRFYKWWKDKLKNNIYVIINSLDDIPEEASKEKEFLIDQGIQSLIFVPINTTEGELTGFIGIHNTEKTGDWRAEDGLALKTVAEMIQAYQERLNAQKALSESEERHKTLFEESPVSMWEENITELNIFLDSLRSSGVKNLGKHFNDHPESLQKCMTLVKIENVNRAAIELLEAADKDDLLGNIAKTFDDHSAEAFRKGVIALFKGEKKFEAEKKLKTLKGNIKDVSFKWHIPETEGGKNNIILYSEVDITKRKKIEDQMAAVNNCLLGLGTYYRKNVNKITAAAGKILNADVALYTIINNDRYQSIGMWNTPDDYNPEGILKGKICNEVISIKEEYPIVVNNMQQSKYAKTDPNIEKFRIHTYIGHVVRMDNKPIGILCLLYNNNYEPTENELNIFGALAGALKTEEKRNSAQELLKDYSDKLRAIAHGTAGVTGENFFRPLIRHVMKSFDATMGFVGELTNDSREMKTLAYRDENKFIKNIQYDVKNTPCSKVIKEGSYFCSSGLADKFPRDKWLRDNDIESYWGHRLNDSSGKPIGELCILDKKPMEKSELIESILEIFAARAAAELERMQTDRKIRASEERYRSLTQSASDAIISGDSRGNIISWNSGAEKLFGYSSEDIVGKPITDLMPEEFRERHSKGLQDYAAGRNARIIGKTIELVALDKDNNEIPVELGLSSWKTGKELYFTAIIRNITARKEAEEKIFESDRQLKKANQDLKDVDRLKSEMVAITSHDLKSPLAGMINYINLITEFYDSLDKDKIIQYLEAVMVSGYKMSRFIDEMLDLERIETGRYELKIKQLIPESILEESVKANRVNADKRNIGIVFIDKGERKATFTDPIKLEQVFNNIITNSIKFAPENSKIRVTFKEIKGDKFKVSISDSGPGIPKNELGNIFDRYYQARSGVKTAQRAFGLGLGLYISRKIVLLHGGKIWAKNNPKEGCVFHIEIPYNDKSEPER